MWIEKPTVDVGVNLTTYSGLTELGQILLANEVDINQAWPKTQLDTQNYTPLHIASDRGHEKFVEFLLNSNAD